MTSARMMMSACARTMGVRVQVNGAHMQALRQQQVVEGGAAAAAAARRCFGAGAGPVPPRPARTEEVRRRAGPRGATRALRRPRLASCRLPWPNRD